MNEYLNKNMFNNNNILIFNEESSKQKPIIVEHFIEKMLKDDIKNNSVWNYRFFLVQYMNGNKLDKNIIEKEIKYSLDKIKECPKNESPYCYIRGYITKYNCKYSDFSFIKEFLEI